MVGLLRLGGALFLPHLVQNLKRFLSGTYDRRQTDARCLPMALTSPTSFAIVQRCKLISVNKLKRPATSR
eukprot:1683768-Rhodomonas_salina.3